MDFLSFKLEMSEDNIKMYKRHYKILLAVVIFTISTIVIDFYMLKEHGLNNFTLTCLGALIGNIFWLLSEVMSIKSDLKLERHFFKHLKDMIEREDYVRALENLKGAEMQHKSAAECYNDLKSKSAYRENKPPESASPVAESS